MALNSSSYLCFVVELVASEFGRGRVDTDYHHLPMQRRECVSRTEENGSVIGVGVGVVVVVLTVERGIAASWLVVAESLDEK